MKWPVNPREMVNGHGRQWTHSQNNLSRNRISRFCNAHGNPLDLLQHFPGLWRTHFLPLSVSVAPRTPRIKSGADNSSSSCRIWLVTAGWVTQKYSAQAEMLPDLQSRSGILIGAESSPSLLSLLPQQIAPTSRARPEAHPLLLTADIADKQKKYAVKIQSSKPPCPLLSSMRRAHDPADRLPPTRPQILPTDSPPLPVGRAYRPVL